MTMRRLTGFLSWAVMIFWLGLSLLAMGYVILAGRSPSGPELFGYRFLAVQTDSMTPTINSGDLVIGQPPRTAAIDTGTVITFRNNRDGHLVTHRVIRVEEKGSQLAYYTKGDANGLEDDFPVYLRDVVALYRVRIPFLGYLVTFARSWVGLVTFVVIPGALLMLTEARRLRVLMRQAATLAAQNTEKG
jgi:signal peptidase